MLVDVITCKESKEGCPAKGKEEFVCMESRNTRGTTDSPEKHSMVINVSVAVADEKTANAASLEIDLGDNEEPKQTPKLGVGFLGVPDIKDMETGSVQSKDFLDKLSSQPALAGNPSKFKRQGSGTVGNLLTADLKTTRNKTTALPSPELQLFGEDERLSQVSNLRKDSDDAPALRRRAQASQSLSSFKDVEPQQGVKEQPKGGFSTRLLVVKSRIAFSSDSGSKSSDEESSGKHSGSNGGGHQENPKPPKTWSKFGEDEPEAALRERKASLDETPRNKQSSDRNIARDSDGLILEARRPSFEDVMHSPFGGNTKVKGFGATSLAGISKYPIGIVPRSIIKQSRFKSVAGQQMSVESTKSIQMKAITGQMALPDSLFEDDPSSDKYLAVRKWEEEMKGTELLSPSESRHSGTLHKSVKFNLMDKVRKRAPQTEESPSNTFLRLDTNQTQDDEAEIDEFSPSNFNTKQKVGFGPQ